jgi:RNA polymerase sigma factor (sigma-70 family)
MVMASAQLAEVLRHIHQIAGKPDDDWNDTQLLQCFLERGDESAFRLLVERHGGMVLSVCRNVLRQHQDAEDTFQATFLVLARNAASIRQGTALASWLYGVAYRTALKARSQMCKRQQHERRAGKVAETRPDLDLAWRELQAVLSEEVNRLADKYRTPFVLCCLEGLSKGEAARKLGWKEGTVSGRLAEARKRLQQRLSRRGLTLAAALCAGAWGAAATAAVPKSLMRSTVQAALGLAAGQAASGVAPAPVAALVEGVTRTMWGSKVELLSVLVLLAGLVGAGVGSHFLRASANPALEDEAPAATAKKAEKPPDEKPAVKEDKVAVTGRVLDPDGKPVAGARVFMPGSVWGQAEKTDRPLAENGGGTDGRFRLTMRRSDLVKGRSLVATAAGYGLDWKAADGLGGKEITFQLSRELPIEGRVLDLQGRPVKGVSVHVQEVAAASEGDFDAVLKSIQRDGNRVFSHPLRAVYMAADSGVIPPTKTNEAGRFRITGVGAERVAELRVEGPTIEHQSIYVLTRPGVNIEKLLKNVPNRIGIPLQLPAIYGPTFDHAANATRPITGVVRDRATGKPVADVWINGSAPNSWWENYVRAKTDREGRYRLIGLRKARSYHLSVWGLQQNYLQAGKNVGDREGLEPITQDFELIRGVRVRGRITDTTTGKPVPAALWYIPLADNKAFAMMPSKDSSLFGGLGHRTEKDGSYSLLALPGPGLIKVRAEIEGENPYTQAALDPVDKSRANSTDPDEGLGITFIGVGGVIETLFGHNAYRIIDPAPEAESVTCDMQFDRGQTRIGVVLDSDGNKPTGVRAGGLTAMGGNRTLTDSSFTVLALNPGQPRLIVFAHRERKLVGHLRLSADAKEPVQVRLQPGVALTGRLLDEDGKPLPGVTVSAGYRSNATRWLSDEISSSHPVVSDADGRFRVEAIFPGMQFGLGLRKGNRFLVTDEKYQTMTLKAGTRDLGDITAKPFRPQ